ncbi:hypothetical protein JTE90_013400 [Oedothorax gibbosus]|uniref:Uncharacterized protein n=1 Tax=Oedothorax gibbosus TaxID=931172 RepID=A0AAV6TX65_9ARAC|nr:hypothetical protein JTE90_013400 [Oedothorax gibbosus]
MIALTYNWRGALCLKSAVDIVEEGILRKNDLKVLSVRVLDEGRKCHSVHQHMTSCKRREMKGERWQSNWDSSDKGRYTHNILEKVSFDLIFNNPVIIYFITGQGSFPTFLNKIEAQKKGGKPHQQQSATGKDTSKKLEKEGKTGNLKGKGSGLKNTARNIAKLVRKDKDSKEGPREEDQAIVDTTEKDTSSEGKDKASTSGETDQEFPRRFINNLVEGLKKENNTMNDFPRIETLGALNARLDELSQGLGFNTTKCNIPTLFEGITVPPGTVVQMQDRAKSKEERASIASGWASKYLMMAAPRKVALWCVNSFFMERGMAEICNARYNPIVHLCQNSTALESATAAQIRTYGALSRQFRQNLGDAVFPIAEFSPGEQNIQARVNINTALAARMLDMLTAMVAKRNARLGAIPQQGKGCMHYDSYC